MTETKISYNQFIPIQKITAQRYLSPYNHDFDIGMRKPSFTFLYVVKGHVVFSTMSNALEGNEGDFFYIPYGIRYTSSWFGENGTEHYCIHAYPTDSRHIFIDPYVLQKIPELSNPESFAEIYRIYQALEEKQENYARTIEQFFSLYSKILPILKKEDAIKHPELLIQAVKYIETHYQEPLTVPSIAFALGVSESNLYHLFQKNMGTTPVKYYNQIRLEQVISAMKSNQSIEDIAYQNGFQSYGYFREIFKAYTGMTPRQYRIQKYG